MTDLTLEDAARRVAEVVRDTGCDWTEAAIYQVENLSMPALRSAAVKGLAQVARDVNLRDHSSYDHVTTSRGKVRQKRDVIAESLASTATESLWRIMRGASENKPFAEFDPDDRAALAEASRLKAEGHMRTVAFVLRTDSLCSAAGVKTVKELDLAERLLLAQEVPW